MGRAPSLKLHHDRDRPSFTSTQRHSWRSRRSSHTFWCIPIPIFLQKAENIVKTSLTCPSSCLILRAHLWASLSYQAMRTMNIFLSHSSCQRSSTVSMVLGVPHLSFPQGSRRTILTSRRKMISRGVCYLGIQAWAVNTTLCSTVALVECIGDGTCAFKLLQPANNFGRYATSTAVLTFAGASFYRALLRPDAEKGWKDAWLEQRVGPHPTPPAFPFFFPLWFHCRTNSPWHGETFTLWTHSCKLNESS